MSDDLRTRLAQAMWEEAYPQRVGQPVPWGSRWWRSADAVLAVLAVLPSEGWERCGWMGPTGFLWRTGSPIPEDCVPVYRRVDGAAPPEPERYPEMRGFMAGQCVVCRKIGKVWADTGECYEDCAPASSTPTEVGLLGRARRVLAAAHAGRLVAYTEWASAIVAVAAIADEMGDGVSPECSGFADKILAALSGQQDTQDVGGGASGSGTRERVPRRKPDSDERRPGHGSAPSPAAPGTPTEVERLREALRFVDEQRRYARRCVGSLPLEMGEHFERRQDEAHAIAVAALSGQPDTERTEP